MAYLRPLGVGLIVRPMGARNTTIHVQGSMPCGHRRNMVTEGQNAGFVYIRLMLVPLLLVVTLGLTGCGAGNVVTGASLFQDGRRAFEEGRLTAAAAAFEGARKEEPTNREVTRWLARTYQRTGRYADSIALYEALVEADPSVAADWTALGNLRFGLAHYQQALTSFERAKTIGDLDVSSRVLRAMSATYVDKPKLALSWLKEDRDALKHLGSYHLALARTHVALSRPDEAIASYRKASVLEPQNPIPESEAGAVYEAIGFKDRATKAYFRALKRNGEHHPTLIRLGSILVSQGKVLDAIPYFERAKRLSPDNVVVLSRLGSAFSAAGMLREAVSTLTAAIKLAPERPELFSSLAEAAYRQGDLALAETQLRTAITLDPLRVVDANALRYVVLMQEMVAIQCKGVKDAQTIQSALQARWTHEGWSPDLVERELGRMLNDADALLIVDELATKCSAKHRK